MKWFFTTNESSICNKTERWEALIKAAVLSCKKNTQLEPCCIYDGEETLFIQWLQQHGVTIYRHRSSIYDHIVRVCKIHHKNSEAHLQIAASAFLRIDIPDLVSEDNYALYTDCDVLFLNDPVLEIPLPKLLAFAPQTNRGDYMNLNSGVILMNVPSLRTELPAFRTLITSMDQFPLSYDQGAYRLFYADRYDLLPDELNWKPYWGFNPSAKIVHFHGPKPFIAAEMINNPDYRTHEVYHKLFNENPSAYREYITLWESFLS